MKSLIKNPIHPGKYLKMAYVTPLELTVTGLASEIGVNTSTLSRLITEKSELSYDMAIRLEKRFSKSAEFWISMQTAHGLSQERKRLEVVEELA